MNFITTVGVIGLFLMSNFIWYWQGFKDGRLEGYLACRNINHQAFWSE